MIPISRHGRWEIVGGTLLLGLLAVGGWWVHPLLAAIPLAIWVWLVAFFRDPERPITSDPKSLVSPADGTVSDVTEIAADPDLGGEPAVRIGIFLSVFSVHVNRSPCDASVAAVRYRKGKFVNALRHGEASAENESNLLVLSEPGGGAPVVTVRQIVGLIARRIICTAQTGDRLARGQRFGLIKFGSRTELTIARRLGPQVRVSVGQKVRGGSDVVAVIDRPLAATGASSAAG